MKLENNKEKTINFRVTEDQYNIFNYVCKLSGHTPSSLCRLLVYQCNLEIKRKLDNNEISMTDIERVLNE